MYAATQSFRTDDMDEVIAAYRALPQNYHPDKALGIQVASYLKRLVAAQYSMSPEAVAQMRAFSQEIAKQVQAGEWENYTTMCDIVTSALISTGDLDSAYSFWQWREKQPNQRVSWFSFAYAAEIHIARGDPLSTVEDLYEKALLRLPGDFMSYHVSPGAVLPNREEIMRVKPTPLLQRLVHAYLLAGRASDAYITLDTMLRLDPKASLSDAFIRAATLRPFSESYTLFALTTQIHGRTSGFVFNQMFDKAADQARVFPAKALLSGLRSRLAAIHQQDMQTTRDQVNVFTTWISCLTEVLHLPSMALATRPERQDCALAILSLVKRLVAIIELKTDVTGQALLRILLSKLAQFDDTDEVFNYATGISAKQHGSDRGVQLCIITLGGKQHNRKRIEKGWADLMTTLSNSTSQLGFVDMRVLIIAANRAGCQDFAKEQFAKYESSFTPEVRDSISALFEFDQEHDRVEREPRHDPTTYHEVMNEIDNLFGDVEVYHRELVARIKDPKHEGLRFPRTVFQPEGALRLSDADMRSLYEEFSTEGHSSPEADDPVATQDPATQPTTQPPESKITADEAELNKSGTSSKSVAAASAEGKSINELRYWAWRDMTYVLQLTDRHERMAGHSSVQSGASSEQKMQPDEEAVQKMLTDRNQDDFTRFEGFNLTALAEARADPPVEEKASEEQMNAARAEIRRLRRIDRATTGR
jgi:hypothetical protein